MAKYDPAELNTSASIVGQYDYVVNIQKLHKEANPAELLSHAVGVLVTVQSILTVCSVFHDVVKQILPERKRYKDFRVVADGVTAHFVLVLDLRRIRFIDTVQLHEKCTAPPDRLLSGKWLWDLALAHISFPFDLDPGHVGLMAFGNVTGGSMQLQHNRTQEFHEFLRQHESVVKLGTNTAVCQMMSWGRRKRVENKMNGQRKFINASPRLLLYRIKLTSDQNCRASCTTDDDRFCPSNVTDLKACAYRGSAQFSYEMVDYSDHPCIGTEGSPVICHPSGNPGKADIYGIASTFTDYSCFNSSLPVLFTPIDEVSKFVVDVIGKAFTLRPTPAVLFFLVVLSAECEIYNSQL